MDRKLLLSVISLFWIESRTRELLLLLLCCIDAMYNGGKADILGGVGIVSEGVGIVTVLKERMG